MAPAARAIVTKYKEESQSKLVEWLKDGGLLDDAGEDIEKVKQQIKRRKMTLKRKQKRVAMVSQSSEEEGSEEEDVGETAVPKAIANVHVNLNANGTMEYDDPLCSAKINMLQDDSFVSLIDPPEHGRLDASQPDPYESDEEHFAPFVGSNPFGEGPYSPTTVIDEEPHAYSFHSVFEHPPLLHTTDLFPRSSHDYPLSQLGSSHKRENPRAPSPPAVAGLDPSGTYFHAAV